MASGKLSSRPRAEVVTVSPALVMPEARALAGVIRRRRECLQLSQSELARRSRVSRPMISNIERDVNIPTADTIARIARGLDISYGELNMAVTGWLRRQPACCQACQYACLALGELKWLNPRHGCCRPAH